MAKIIEVTANGASRRVYPPYTGCRQGSCPLGIKVLLHFAGEGHVSFQRCVLFLLLPQVFKILGHLIERRSQHPELILLRNRDSYREIAFADPQRGVAQPIDDTHNALTQPGRQKQSARVYQTQNESNASERRDPRCRSQPHVTQVLYGPRIGWADLTDHPVLKCTRLPIPRGDYNGNWSSRSGDEIGLNFTVHSLLGAIWMEPYGFAVGDLQTGFLCQLLQKGLTEGCPHKNRRAAFPSFHLMERADVKAALVDNDAGKGSFAKPGRRVSIGRLLRCHSNQGLAARPNGGRIFGNKRGIQCWRMIAVGYSGAKSLVIIDNRFNPFLNEVGTLAP